MIGLHITSERMASSSHVGAHTIRPLVHTQKAGLVPIVALTLFMICGVPEAAVAVHAEPANALSLPTWVIHASSVLEWVTAMYLIWRYADVSKNPVWRTLTWGMVPSLGGAMSACTWHFFYNDPSLEWLVTLQSMLTFLGNCTCWWAAYKIYQSYSSAQADSAAK